MHPASWRRINKIIQIKDDGEGKGEDEEEEEEEDKEEYDEEGKKKNDVTYMMSIYGSR